MQVLITAVAAKTAAELSRKFIKECLFRLVSTDQLDQAWALKRQALKQSVQTEGEQRGCSMTFSSRHPNKSLNIKQNMGPLKTGRDVRI